MSSVKVVLNQAAVGALLRSPEMMAICEEQAQELADQLGEGYEVKSFTGFDRVHSLVIASSEKAIKENLENNSMLHAMGGTHEND